MELSFDRLRRWPDTEAENLVAVDATDRLLLDEAADAVREHPDAVAVLGDAFGALTLGAVALHGATGVRVHQDRLSGELALAANAAAVGLTGTYTSYGLEPALVQGAKVVLLRLPKSLPALQEMTELLARHADRELVVYAGGRVKHMTHGMNDVLRLGFDEVHATLARQKSRLLVASQPRDDVETTFPRRETHADVGLEVCAYGAVFGGTKIDNGTRRLVEVLDRMRPDARTAVDLGCGTGVLAALLARGRDDLDVLATDESTSAVRSAAETMEANDLGNRVRVTRDDAMSEVADHSVDLVVCNPPFHVDTAVHAGAAAKLFAAAARVLSPDGELWTVSNTHLGHRPTLERLVGPTKIGSQDRKFTVLVSRPASPP
jgi:16S rRNA (guanine1207-N2)-methyltransferase